jgi:hypothetical protein
MTPILYAKRRRLRFQGSPEFFRCAPPPRKLLFCTRTGKPLSPTNIVRRHLHVALKELNYVNPSLLRKGALRGRWGPTRRAQQHGLQERTRCGKIVRTPSWWCARRTSTSFHATLFTDIRSSSPRPTWSPRARCQRPLQSPLPHVGQGIRLSTLRRAANRKRASRGVHSSSAISRPASIRLVS